jgi:hypothetical protein
MKHRSDFMAQPNAQSFFNRKIGSFTVAKESQSVSRDDVLGRMLKTPPKKHEKFTDSEVFKRGVRKMQTPSRRFPTKTFPREMEKLKTSFSFPPSPEFRGVQLN